ncbi:MAG TPA: hypothetical protein VI483_03190 [Candidatus Paceibacterota bacterium]
MKEVTTKIEGELITHRLLWRCCIKQMEAARSRENDASYFHLTAMLMAYFTYEAYLNFLGDRIAPKVWEDERRYFSKKPYRGADGKLRKIAEICGFEIERGKRPHETIVELEKLRNFVAHGKPDKYEEKVKHQPEREPSMFGYDTLSKYITQEKAERAINDGKEFIEFLHERCRAKVRDGWYGDKALEGSLGYASSQIICET